MKSCFFIGPKDDSRDISPALVTAVEQHVVQHGVTGFVVGNDGTFDRLAAEAVIAVKERYPHITLTMLLPYPSEKFSQMPPAGFDNAFYPPGMELVQRRFAIARASRYMVDHVHYLIIHAQNASGDIKNLEDYAKMRESYGLLTVTEL